MCLLDEGVGGEQGGEKEEIKVGLLVLMLIVLYLHFWAWNGWGTRMRALDLGYAIEFPAFLGIFLGVDRGFGWEVASLSFS